MEITFHLGFYGVCVCEGAKERWWCFHVFINRKSYTTHFQIDYRTLISIISVVVYYSMSGILSICVFVVSSSSGWLCFIQYYIDSMEYKKRRSRTSSLVAASDFNCKSMYNMCVIYGLRATWYARRRRIQWWYSAAGLIVLHHINVVCIMVVWIKDLHMFIKYGGNFRHTALNILLWKYINLRVMSLWRTNHCNNI